MKIDEHKKVRVLDPEVDPVGGVSIRTADTIPAPPSDPPEYPPPFVGSAIEEPPGPEPEEPPDRVALAHYDGMTDAQAEAAWKSETICAACLCAPVCAVAGASANTLVVVKRCTAFLPVQKPAG